MWLKCLLLGYLLNMAAAGPRHGPMRARQNNDTLVQAYKFSMPVDHFNDSDTRKYDNRYWVNDAFYRPGGPVMFYDFGENGVANDYARAYLCGSVVKTAVVELARQYSGLIIGWEHRYYGYSTPVPWLRGNFSKLGTANEGGLPRSGFDGWQYLTVEQALEDVVYFAKHFNLSDYEAQDLSPGGTPWVWIGGSYPGTRGAYIRQRNPDIFHAVWASCAPVQARTNQAVYFNPIYRSMPSNCSADVHAVVQYVDGILSSSQQTLIANLKRMDAAAQSLIGNSSRPLAVKGAAEASAYSVATDLMQPLISGFQEYGPALSVHRFCDMMQSYDPGTRPDSSLGMSTNMSTYALSVLNNPGTGKAKDAGIASRHGVEIALNAYFYASRMYEEYIITNVTLEDTLINIPSPDYVTDLHSWQYQSVTELGFLKGSEPGSPMNMVSKYLNISSLRSRLLDLYFGEYSPDRFPKEPNIDTVLRYGGWDMRPSNVMFSEGEFDPWRSLSVLSEENTINAPMRTATQDVPVCGQPPNGTNVFGLVYPGAAHVFDMTKDPFVDGNGTDTPLDQGVALFSKALDRWLPCFERKAAAGSG